MRPAVLSKPLPRTAVPTICAALVLAGVCAAGLLAVPAAAQTAGSVQAGVAAAVRGEVRQVALAVPPSGSTGTAVGRVVASGDRIFLGDRIETGPHAGLQIMLLDETIFTIGPDAAMVIDRFVYDPDSDAGQVAASIVKGAFRFVSGRIAKRNPGDMNLRVGVATMGIRGTSAAGNVVEPGADGEPGKADVVLLGPGPANNADEREGRVTFGNAGTDVEISRPGYGSSVVGEQGAPSPPVRLTLEQINAITAGLTGAGAGGPDGGGNGAPGNGSNGGGDGGDSGDGQNGDGNTAGGGQSVSAGNVNQLSGQNVGVGASVAQVQIENFETVTQPLDQEVQTATEAADNSSTVQSAIATFENLRSIQTGEALFNMNDVPLVDSGNVQRGDYDAAFLIQFGARKLTVAVTDVSYQFSGAADRTFAFGETIPYDAMTGPTTTDRDSVANPNLFIFDGCDGPCANDIVTIQHEILNTPDGSGGGTIASAARISVSVESVADGTVIAGGQTAPRN